MIIKIMGRKGERFIRVIACKDERFIKIKGEYNIMVGENKTINERDEEMAKKIEDQLIYKRSEAEEEIKEIEEKIKDIKKYKLILKHVWNKYILVVEDESEWVLKEELDKEEYEELKEEFLKDESIIKDYKRSVDNNIKIKIDYIDIEFGRLYIYKERKAIISFIKENYKDFELGPAKVTITLPIYKEIRNNGNEIIEILISEEQVELLAWRFD